MLETGEGLMSHTCYKCEQGAPWRWFTPGFQRWFGVGHWVTGGQGTEQHRGGLLGKAPQTPAWKLVTHPAGRLAQQGKPECLIFQFPRQRSRPRFSKISGKHAEQRVFLVWKNRRRAT